MDFDQLHAETLTRAQYGAFRDEFEKIAAPEKKKKRAKGLTGEQISQITGRGLRTGALAGGGLAGYAALPAAAKKYLRRVGRGAVRGGYLGAGVGLGTAAGVHHLLKKSSAKEAQFGFLQKMLKRKALRPSQMRGVRRAVPKGPGASMTGLPRGKRPTGTGIRAALQSAGLQPKVGG